MFLTYLSRFIEYNGRSKTNCKGSESIVTFFVRAMGSFFKTLDVDRKNDQKNTDLPVKKKQFGLFFLIIQSGTDAKDYCKRCTSTFHTFKF